MDLHCQRGPLYTKHTPSSINSHFIEVGFQRFCLLKWVLKDFVFAQTESKILLTWVFKYGSKSILLILIVYHFGEKVTLVILRVH